MTASSLSRSLPSVGRSNGLATSLSGLRPLVRKDLGEWVHGVRGRVVLLITAAFMALGVANGFIQAWVIAHVPEAAAKADDKVISLVPLDNLFAAPASQFFVMAAIFAAMSLLVAERESGTLAWIASKPVSRTSIWLSKMVSATVALGLAAGLLPFAAAAAVVTVLYGAPPIGAVVVIGVAIVASVAFYVAVALAASTAVRGQAAVAGIAFAVFLAPTLIGGLLPINIAPYLPTSIVPWAMGLAQGADVGIATPIAWLVGVVALAVVATRRMEAIEL